MTISQDSLTYRRFRYAIRPQLAWLAVLMMIWTLLILFSHREACIRWWGTLLQLVGVAAVVHELRSALDLFGRRLLAEVHTYWRGWPKSSHVATPVTGEMNFTLPAVTLSAYGSTGLGNGSLEQRIRALEANLQVAQASIGNLSQRIDVEARERKAADATEAGTRRSEIDSLGTKVVTVATGSAWISIFGIWWLGVGIVLGGNAQDFSRWFAHLVNG